MHSLRWKAGRRWGDQAPREQEGRTAVEESQDMPKFQADLSLRSESRASSASLLPSKDSHALGLKLLAHGSNPSVDIIAVHGLNGDREKTWTSKNGTLWLRDLLPLDIPQARILTYGFDSRTHGSAHITVQFLYDHAVTFVEKLCTFRRNTKTEERPIIFFAHSLGGILVKSALIHSNLSGPRHLPEQMSIKTSTYGIFFFGTPHSGSNSASWGMVLLNIASAFAKTNTSIIKHLKTNSEWLRQQMSQFRSISPDFDIIYIYEGLKTPLALGRSTIIVPQESAVVTGIPNTESLCLAKNHKDLVHFDTQDDEDYISVVSCLELMESKCHEVIMQNWKSQRIQAEGIMNEKSLGDAVPQDSRLYRLPFKVPVEKNRLFKGREVLLQQIRDHFSPLSPRTSLPESVHEDRIIILYGLGGMGKTQLALRYAVEQTNSVSAVIWINCSSERNAQLGYRDVAQRYVNVAMEEEDANIRQRQLHRLRLGDLLKLDGQVSTEDTKLSHITKAVIEFLERQENDSWLMVLDNVDDLDSFPISDLIPKTPTRKIIITSRLTVAARLGYAIEVDAIEEDDAVEILLANSQLRIKSSSDHECAKKIVKTLGYLPLAIEQAGAYISDVQLQLDEYLPLFEEHRRELLARANPGGIYTVSKETVFTTWELSFKSLERQDHATAKLMLLLAFLNNESPWEGLFLLAAEGSAKSDFRLGAMDDFGWLKDLSADKLRFKNSFGKILSVSLAKRGPLPGSLYLHPLVHAWGRDRLDSEQRFKPQLHALMVIGQACLAVSSSSPQNMNTWILKQRLLLHADACVGFARSDHITCDWYSLFRHAEAAPAIFHIAELYHDFGRLKQAESLLSSVVSLSVPDFTQDLFLRCQLKLADTFIMQGSHAEAEKLYRKILPFTHVEGVSQQIALLCHTGLGRVYWILYRYKEAEENLKLVTDTLTAANGELGVLGQQAASNLALVYWHRGRPIDALAWLNKVLGELGAKGFADDMSTLEHEYRKAIMLQELGHWNSAESIFARVFATRQKLLGLVNLETCQAANALARIYLFQGRYAKAREHFDIAWNGQEKLGLGMDHPAVLRTLYNYGVLNREEGLYEEAYECLERSFSWEMKLGCRNKSYLNRQTEIAVLETDSGKPETAIEILNTVREIQEADYLCEDPECIRSKKYLGDALLLKGDTEQAEHQLASALLLAQQEFHPEHPDLLRIQTSIARLRHYQGRGVEVLKDLEIIIVQLGSVFGKLHQVTLLAGALLGQIYLQVGRESEGRKKIERAIDSMSETLGVEHPKTRELISFSVLDENRE